MLLKEQIKQKNGIGFLKSNELKKERKGLNRITLSQQHLQHKKESGSTLHNRIIYKSDLKLSVQQNVSVEQIQSNIKMVEHFNLTSLQFQYQSLHNIPSIIQKKEQNQKNLQNTKQSQKKLKNNKNLNEHSLKNIQRIYLYTNYLKSFDKIDFCSLINLNQLNLDQNLITKIPAQELNKFSNLRILKLNCNQIEIVPYLKYVIQLELIQNPIKLITDNLQMMTIQKLEIDWIDYIFPEVIRLNIKNEAQKQQVFAKSVQNSQDQSIISRLKKMTRNIKSSQVWKLKNKKDTYLEFKDLFQYQNKKQKQVEQKISILLFKAIKDDHFFFIRYLLSNCMNLRYNKMNVYNKYVIDLALSSRSNQILSLFCPNIWPYPKDQIQPFLTNVLSGIKYHNSQFIKYLLQVNPGFKFNQINRKTILTQIIINFQQKNQKDKEILKVFFENFQLNSSLKSSQLVVFDLNQLPLNKSTQIADFFHYILNSPQFKIKIDILKTNEYYSNSLLHFAIKAKHLSLTLFCLKNLELNVFQRNKTQHQTARCLQGADILSKKILWKKQKAQIKILFQQSQKKQRKYQKLMKINESFMSNCYQNLKRQKQLMRNSKSKNINILQEFKRQLVKIFQDNNQQVERIFLNSFQYNFTQTQQQIIFIVNKIIQSKTLIIDKRKINQILKVVNKVQSYDKRSYIFDQLNKLVLKYDNKKSLLSDGNQNISTQYSNKCIQFQLYHSNLAFTQPHSFYFEKQLMQKAIQKKQYICGIDVSKLECKKCN